MEAPSGADQALNMEAVAGVDQALNFEAIATISSLTVEAIPSMDTSADQPMSRGTSADVSDGTEHSEAHTKAQHFLNLIVANKETVLNATRAMRYMLKDLKLVADEMLDLTKAAEGVHQELNDAVVVQQTADKGEPGGSQIKISEPEEENGGFGTFEVMQTMEMLKWQVMQLHHTAASVASRADHGAAEVIHQAMIASSASETGEKIRRQKTSSRFSVGSNLSDS